jgi:hypothetical protein
MMSLVVGFSFFLSFLIKKEKKEEKEFQLKKSSCEKEAKNQFTKGGLSCANMKELMNSNFLHSFKKQSRKVRTYTK